MVSIGRSTLLLFSRTIWCEAVKNLVSGVESGHSEQCSGTEERRLIYNDLVSCLIAYMYFVEMTKVQGNGLYDLLNQ